MMRALDPVVVDLIFHQIKPLLPKPRPHRIGGGRTRVPDRVCFKGIFHKVATGNSWEYIETYVLNNTVSDTTLRTRRNEWINAGVFEQLAAQAVLIYDRLIGLDFSDVCIDGSNKPAPGGGPKAAPYWGSKGRLGYKISLATEATGLPVGWVLDSANRNDFVLLEATLDDIEHRTGTTRTITTLHLDRGYGYKALNKKLDGRDIDNIEVVYRNQPNQGRTELIGLKKRWTVERTISWLSNYRELRRSYDRTTTGRYASIALAITALITTRLLDHQNHPK